MELDLPFSDPSLIVEEEEVEEQSVLEYAREQGICVDYTTELPRLVDICLSLRDSLDLDLWDPLDDDLANAVTAADELVKRRIPLAVSKETAYILRSLRAVDTPLTSRRLAEDGLQRIRELKQELPVLETDVDLDMLAFGTKSEFSLGDLKNRLTSEDLDEENDEGFGWPAKYFDYPAQCDARIKSEKLAVTKEALKILESVMCDQFTPEDNAKFMAEALEMRREPAPRYLTPPLLPLSPPSSPYIPSSPANRLPLIPASSDSVTAEVKALDQKIMAQDSVLRLNSGSSDSMLLDGGDLTIAEVEALFNADNAASPTSSDRIPAILKRKIDDLKVEGPLTPPMFSDSPMKKLKSVSFSKMIQVGDNLEPWPDEDHPVIGSEDIMNVLLKEIEPVANEANRKIETERLTGADTVARVEVPFLDFTLPVAPWDEFSQRKDAKHRTDITELEAQMRFLQRVKRDDLRSATAWRGVSDLDLVWGWFASPNASSIKLHEQLHGESEFKKIQAELKIGNIAKSSTEVWKRDGLRVLDEDEDDEEEEIEPYGFEEQGEIDALVRKRKLGLEEQLELEQAHHRHKEGAHTQLNLLDPRSHQGRDESSTFQLGSNHLHKMSNNAQPQQKQSSAAQQKAATEQKTGPTELMFGRFSAFTALERFMEIQGKVTKPANPSCQADASSALPVQPLSSNNNGPHPQSRSPRDLNYGHLTDDTARHEMKPAPAFDLPASSFITSLSLLQRRSLVKEVERLHPNADLIYRDYTLQHTTCAEADINLSPSTGVFLTTLQQIKQMPLPGQAARSSVKERMATLQERYERVLVLVGEGLREETGYNRPEDARDKEALSGLEAFAAQLEGDVSVEFVPGAEQALANAVVESMGKYGLPHDGKDMKDIKLFPMETTWEVFLRRAGLNPFAAQVIIASLKTPTIIDLPPLLSSPADHTPQRMVETNGLSTFLLMGREERVKHFQAILGGRRILDKVSELLDQQWLSAAHGFRM